MKKNIFGLINSFAKYLPNCIVLYNYLTYSIPYRIAKALLNVRELFIPVIDVCAFEVKCLKRLIRYLVTHLRTHEKDIFLFVSIF